ncbi:aromatic ring hydroxylase [Candidatus Gottesmanbacteria bacterium RBG_13_37_7]|uniref:Aromatic ring hydroxylase n=1 Tax=Candidatus Gottesmanbacteria bacterium RBG_13_37_7 TaxID=1798369 RepID=A0A1F5YJX6_9BACT|nr:MAG: aromatic ring hydroxylase [Candidatus Gottesmanbacteria bacterium RBG_13_37_7]
MITKKKVLQKLKKVPDPELGISIVDLGLIYDIKIEKTNSITVVMTLTSTGCPLLFLIEKLIKKEIGSLKGVKEVTVEVTFDPPWNPDKISKAGKKKLGFI